SIVGHSSTAMTRHYYHANESALRQAVNAIPSFGAACAGVRARSARSARSAARPPTVVQRLERANKLLARGLVSEAEHAALRARILADV
ncbi:MAG: SHOCT domain-containing protein, partial [Kiritimatiellae bacterium]|nr:SHOCT domain-containing protein [Kiritimatiellia bacterium]